jgi:molybdopterin/thiamine biosynthesis adenylyltransferase
MLTPQEKAVYEWQLDVKDFGVAGQEKLKSATALVSRCGGLGGPLAYSLAAAGFGKIIIAHGGKLKPSDLNRQIAMTSDKLGTLRSECAVPRLQALNPFVMVEGVPENISEANASTLTAQADIVFGAAPLFSERFLLNRECVRQKKPFVDAAMYEMEGRILTVLPGRTACLACLHPENPPEWQRRFPVLGAVSALAAAVAAIEGIKIVAGFGETLAGKMLYYDARRMIFQRIPIARRPDCPVCGSVYP